MKPEQILGAMLILPAAATAFWGPDVWPHLALAILAGVAAASTWSLRWGWSAALVAGLAPLSSLAGDAAWWLAAPLIAAVLPLKGAVGWIRPIGGFIGLVVYAWMLAPATGIAVLVAGPFVGALGWAATRHPPTWATQDNALRATLVGTGLLLLGAGMFVSRLIESGGTRDGLAMLAIGLLAGAHGIAWTVAARAQSPPHGVWLALPLAAAVGVAWTFVNLEIPTRPMVAVLLAMGSIQVAPVVGLLGRRLPFGVDVLLAAIVAGGIGLLLHG